VELTLHGEFDILLRVTLPFPTTPATLETTVLESSFDFVDFFYLLGVLDGFAFFALVDCVESKDNIFDRQIVL